MCLGIVLKTEESLMVGNPLAIEKTKSENSAIKNSEYLAIDANKTHSSKKYRESPDAKKKTKYETINPCLVGSGTRSSNPIDSRISLSPIKSQLLAKIFSSQKSSTQHYQ